MITPLTLRLRALTRSAVFRTNTAMLSPRSDPRSLLCLQVGTQIRLATQDYGSGSGHPQGEDPQAQGANPSEELEHPGPPPPNVGQDKSGSPSPNEGNEKNSGKGAGEVKKEGESEGKKGKGKLKNGDKGTSGTSAPTKGSGGKGGSPPPATSPPSDDSGPSSSSSSSSSKSKSKDKSASKSSSSPAKDTSPKDSSEEGGTPTPNTPSLGHEHSDTVGYNKVKSGARPRFNTGPPTDVDTADVEKHNREVDERKAKASEYGGDVKDEVGKGFWSGHVGKEGKES